MSLDKIFGDWNNPPTVGEVDKISSLWHQLAAQHVGTPQQRSNNGLTQRRGEWTMLMDLYTRAKPKVVVEIGVAQGGTFAGWCALGEPDALIVGIDRDINDCRPRPGERVSALIAEDKPWLMSAQGGGLYALGRQQQTIKGISGWSYEPSTFSQLKDILGGRKIDWLWTDSSHEQGMFDREFGMYWGLVDDGGVFCTHDIQRSAHPEVTKWKSWERIKQEETYSMMMEFKGGIADDSYGIGVLIKA